MRDPMCIQCDLAIVEVDVVWFGAEAKARTLSEQPWRDV